MHMFGRCLNHDEPKSNAWAHHKCLNLVCYEWTQAQRPVIELYLVWKPKVVSWIILSPILEPIKGVYAWSTSKAKSSQDVCMKCKVKPFQVNTKTSWSWFKPSKCKPKTFYHDQGSSILSLKRPKLTKKKQVAQLCLTPHLVRNIMVKFKVC